MGCGNPTKAGGQSLPPGIFPAERHSARDGFAPAARWNT